MLRAASACFDEWGLLFVGFVTVEMWSKGDGLIDLLVD